MQTFSGEILSGEGSWEGVTWEDLSLEEFFIVEDDFSMKERQISQHYFKNDQKLNKKNKFFQLKVRSSIKS